MSVTRLRHVVTVVSAVYGLLVAVLFCRLALLRFGTEIGGAVHTAVCCCTSATDRVGRRISRKLRTGELSLFALRVRGIRLALLLYAGFDFISDLPVNLFAEHFHTLGAQSGGAQIRTGPASPQIRSQPLCGWSS